MTLRDDAVAPRFDLTTEVLIVETGQHRTAESRRNILLPGPSGDELCSLIIKEDVSLVVCGGIEEAFFQYLSWKKISVIDRVIGSVDEALRLVLAGKLKNGDVLHGFAQDKFA